MLDRLKEESKTAYSQYVKASKWAIEAQFLGDAEAAMAAISAQRQAAMSKYLAEKLVIDYKEAGGFEEMEMYDLDCQGRAL
jgi:hypothetical protein